jgi:hypothetical protein
MNYHYLDLPIDVTGSVVSDSIRPFVRPVLTVTPYLVQLGILGGHLCYRPDALNADSPSFLPHRSINGPSSLPQTKRPVLAFI